MNIILHVNYISILKDTPKNKFMKSITFFHKYTEGIIYLITLWLLYVDKDKSYPWDVK